MSNFLRQASVTARQVSRTRTFASSAVSRKDLVQDLYLREIKAYKPKPVAKDAHVGSVKQYTLPPAPKAPVIPTDLASELSAYEQAEPVAAAAVSATSAVGEEGAGGAAEFLELLEKDLPKPEHHH